MSLLTRVVGTKGELIAEYPGLAAAAWSPDGGRLAALRVKDMAEMMGYYATPVVLDLASGVETEVGPLGFYDTAPAWDPDGRSLAFTCVSTVRSVYGADGSVQSEERMDCHGDGLRVVSVDGSDPRVLLPFSPEDGMYYRNPSWSPMGDTIAVSSHSDSGDCRGYLLVDAQTGAVRTCFPLPPPGGLGGRCGSYEDGVSDWSLDGRHLIYHWEFGAGSNGVWITDAATAEARLIPIAPASFVTLASSGRHLAFGAGGFVWAADLDGSNLTLLAEGYSPAWQPLP